MSCVEHSPGRLWSLGALGTAPAGGEAKLALVLVERAKLRVDGGAVRQRLLEVATRARPRVSTGQRARDRQLHGACRVEAKPREQVRSLDLVDPLADADHRLGTSTALQLL